jgi:hypothetical protein
MDWFREFGRRLLTLLRRGRFDTDLEEEMRLRRSCHHILKEFHRDSTLHGGATVCPLILPSVCGTSIPMSEQSVPGELARELNQCLSYLVVVLPRASGKTLAAMMFQVIQV